MFILMIFFCLVLNLFKYSWEERRYSEETKELVSTDFNWLQWQTCSPSLSPSFSPSCLLISTLSSGPEDLDLTQLRKTGAETPHDSSRIWFWYHISVAWFKAFSTLHLMEDNHTVRWQTSNWHAYGIKQLTLAVYKPHEDRDERRSLMTAEESSSWSYWRLAWQVESLGFPTFPPMLQKPRFYYKLSFISMNLWYWSQYDKTVSLNCTTDIIITLSVSISCC